VGFLVWINSKGCGILSHAFSAFLYVAVSVPGRKRWYEGGGVTASSMYHSLLLQRDRRQCDQSDCSACCCRPAGRWCEASVPHGLTAFVALLLDAVSPTSVAVCVNSTLRLLAVHCCILLQGGGVKRLFRKIDNKSSCYDPHHDGRVRTAGSYIYEEFLPTGGTDVKVC
jgi:hypothetical protein